jgi:hypothetical protein
MIFARIFHEEFQTEEEDERLLGKTWSRSLSLNGVNYQYAKKRSEL